MPTDTAHPSDALALRGPKTFNTELRERFIAAKNSHGEAWSLRRLEQPLNSSASAISKYLGGKPEGNVAALERAIEALLINDALRQEAAPVDGELFETPVARQLKNLCTLARRHRFIRAFVGAPGIGKSCAIRLYIEQDPVALVMELNRVTGGGRVSALERTFLRHCTATDWDKRQETSGEYIIRSFRSLQRLIVIDNGHLLSRQGVEWVLGFHDETGCPIVLIGNSELRYTLALVQRAPSRVGAPVEASLSTSREGGCPLKTPADVARRFLEINWPLAASELAKPAAEVVESCGGLRALRHIVHIAQDWHGRKGLESLSAAFGAARLKQLGKPQAK